MCETKRKMPDYKTGIYSLMGILLLFGIDFRIEYATDSYFLFQTTGNWKHMICSNGRLITGMFMYVAEKLHLTDVCIYTCSWCLAIMCLTAAVTILSGLLMKYYDNRVLCVGLSIITLANFFSVEYFLFLEKGFFQLGILFLVCALRTVEQRLCGEKEKGAWMTAFVWLLLASFTYQITIGMFVILCLPFLLIYARNPADFIKNNVRVACIYGGCLLFQLIWTKYLFHTSRIENEIGSIDFIQNLKETIRTFWTITVHFAWLYKMKYSFLVLLAAVLLYSMTALRKERYFLFRIFYLMAGVAAVSLLPYVSGITKDWNKRLIYPYASVFGILMIIVWITPRVTEKTKKTALWLVGVIFVMEYVCFGNVFIERYKNNQADRELAMTIGQAVREYESRTENIVNYIAVYYDQNTCYQLEGLTTGGMTGRSMVTDWSDVNAINYYLGTDFVRKEPDEKYQVYFGSRDWYTYSPEQLVFEGDTLHMCVY